MGEVRYDPLLDEHVIVAPHRGSRPIMPEGCPFCPADGNAEVAGKWRVLAIPNKFGALTPDADAVESPTSPLWTATPAIGATEVILYTPAHEGGLDTLTPDHLVALAELWMARERELGARPGVKYVFPFENRGAAVGVSQGHPHGQIYAFPFIPGTVAQMLAAQARHHARAGDCLHCGILAAELADARRIVAETPHAVAYVPYAARLPFEVRIAPKAHATRLAEMSADARRDFVVLVGELMGAQKHLYGFELPGILAHYPAPTDGAYPHHHYHVALFPVQRNARQIKFFGGVETAGGTMVNDSAPEARAEEMRHALKRARAAARART